MSLVVVLAVGWFPFDQLLAAQGQAQDNILIILDASGSMADKMSGSRNSKMDEAKQALIKVVQTVPKNTHVGMLIFSSKNLKNDLVYPPGPVDLPKLEQAIRSPVPAGGTPLGAYLKKGADILLKQREAQRGYGTFRLLVVTDGEASDRDFLDRYLPDILSRGITIDVIGVDMKSDHALATRVQSYRRANDPEALVQGLKEVIAEIGASQDHPANPEALATIAAIPEELGKAMLEALVRSSSGNHPIGEQPPRKAAEPTAVAAAAPPAAPASPSGPAPAPPAPRQDQGGGATALVCLFSFFAMVVVLFILIKRASRPLRRD
ncbi:MAG: VWA domain-containing protein [Planctomycetes bacterium]|nr:VWA domain-containing protein [Planctomycetota bacterium]